MATDGTMADYCDILRSHESSDTLNMEVLRFGTGELLEGQLNGRELAVTAVLDNGHQPGPITAMRMIMQMTIPPKPAEARAAC